MGPRVELTDPAREMLDKALALSADERLLIAGILYDSLDDEDPDAVERAWIEEAKRRIAQIESGEVVCRPFDEVMTELRARYL